MEKTENKLALMAIYRDEWMHRDDTFIAMFWRLITISLVISFLPNLIVRVGIEHQAIETLPSWLFSSCGILCALFGMYLSLGEAKRIEAIDKAYKNVMNTLPVEYQMITLSNVPRSRIFRPRLNNIFCISMYLMVCILALANIFIQ